MKQVVFAGAVASLVALLYRAGIRSQHWPFILWLVGESKGKRIFKYRSREAAVALYPDDDIHRAMNNLRRHRQGFVEDQKASGVLLMSSSLSRDAELTFVQVEMHLFDLLDEKETASA